MGTVLDFALTAQLECYDTYEGTAVSTDFAQDLSLLVIEWVDIENHRRSVSTLRRSAEMPVIP